MYFFKLGNQCIVKVWSSFCLFVFPWAGKFSFKKKLFIFKLQVWEELWIERLFLGKMFCFHLQPFGKIEVVEKTGQHTAALVLFQGCLQQGKNVVLKLQCITMLVLVNKLEALIFQKSRLGRRILSSSGTLLLVFPFVTKKSSGLRRSEVTKSCYVWTEAGFVCWNPL